MMTIEMIRDKLHNLIDQVEDRQALHQLYTKALELKYFWVEDDPLTEEEWDQIGLGLAQIQNDEPCTHENAIEKFREWQKKRSR